YDTETAEGLVMALVVDGQRVEEAATGQDVAVVMNQTPFYAEAGGQMGDSGIIATAPGAPTAVRVTVTDTHKKADDLFVHMGRVEEGTLRVGADMALRVDGGRRREIRANHSATHLLHAALRRRLGEHVTQKGSLVAPDRLRFDISHPKAVEADELTAVEAEVNAEIRRNTEVSTRLMDPEQAVAAGAMALFGEKYGDEARVVSMGEDADAEAVFSTELCGGTHVGRTGDIGLFKIVSEGAVAAGVRRIEALTGGAAVDYLSDRERILGQAAALLKAQPADVPGRVEGLLGERRNLERDLAEARRKLATAGAAMEVKDIDGIKFAPQLLDGVPAKDLKGMADEIKEQIGSGVVALISVDQGRASLVVAVSEDLTARVSAIDLVRAGSAAVGGKGGGGRPDMAQAGGPDGAAADEALA
ncbi:MAG: alanine--tRNA ligase-related protein, partial [Rhodospirillales bacterium]|nr:alanine--tRNA ligase-related protein [Rhodospirillales bacterium]